MSYRMAKAECRLAVLGTCCVSLEPGESGVGKSGLCSRFIHPDVDSWDELGYDHSHWLSPSDFQEPEINGDHFVYFGATTRLYQPRGKGKSDVVELKIHVVEHTTFLDDGLSRPFPGSGDYAKRATGSRVASSKAGKSAYSCRSQLGEDAPLYSLPRFEQPSFPVEYSARTGGVNGYLFVLDPSKSAAQRDWQWQCLTECWRQIPDNKKKCCAIALTKCETLPKGSLRLDKTFDVLDRFQGTAGSKKQKSGTFQACQGKLAISDGKHRIPVFLTSAALCYGVDMPFVYLAHRSLKLAGSPRFPTTWSKAIQHRNDMSKSVLLSAHAYFRRHVKSHTTTWSDMVNIYQDQGMEACRIVHGFKVCQSVFKSHLLLLAVGAAEELLKQDIEREQMYGVAAGSVTMDTVMRATRLRSYTVRITKQHPDLRDLVKEKDDGTGNDYERFMDHTRDIHAAGRGILSKPSTIPPTEPDSEEEEEIYEEVGELVDRRKGQPEEDNTAPVYETIEKWHKFDDRITDAWRKMTVPPREVKEKATAPRNHSTYMVGQSGSPPCSRYQVSASPTCAQHQPAASGVRSPHDAIACSNPVGTPANTKSKAMFPFSQESLYARAPPTSPRASTYYDHVLALPTLPTSDEAKTGDSAPSNPSPGIPRSGDFNPLSSIGQHGTQTRRLLRPVSHNAEPAGSAQERGDLAKKQTGPRTRALATCGDGSNDHGGAQESQSPQLDEFGYVRLYDVATDVSSQQLHQSGAPAVIRSGIT